MAPLNIIAISLTCFVACFAWFVRLLRRQPLPIPIRANEREGRESLACRCKEVG
jgi:hypothetical protein